MRNPSFTVLLAITVLFPPLTLGAGPLYRGFSDLRTLETSHFTFIFPRESQPEAEFLVSVAEDLYSQVGSQLGQPTSLHIPVVLTPDTDEANGYFTASPSIRIVLNEAPISPNSGFAIYGNNLKKLFLHELVHAVSLAQTSGFPSFLVALFGDCLYPGLYWTPKNFVEGVTVSFESLDGLGRANDVNYASVIQQSILEDRWPSFTETAGASTGYPGGIFYIYGGWFSRYLQETYGPERYAALFRAFGQARGLEDFLWFRGAFAEVYGRSLGETWSDFRQWMALRVLLRTDVHPVDDGPGLISATVSHGNTVYWADYRGVWAFENGKSTWVTDIGQLASRLAVSDDGTKLLISRMEYQGNLATAVLSEWDLKAQRLTSRTFPGHLTEASYRGDAVVACRIKGYTMDLVLLDGSGQTLWFAGTDRLVPSQPTSMADGTVSFLLQIDGHQRLAVVDPQTHQVSLVEGSGLEGIRHLSSDGRRVWFSWDNDRTFLKLGIWEGDTVWTYPPVAGGVQYPVGVGDLVYYVGDQARGHRLMKLPDLPAQTRSVTQRPLGPDLGPGSLFDRPPQLRSQPYQPWLWALVPQTRYLVLALSSRDRGWNLLRGAGIGTWSSDPTESVALTTSAAWLWDSSFAEWNLGVGLAPGPLNLHWGLFDRLVEDLDWPIDVRETGTNLSLSHGWTGVTNALSEKLDVGGTLVSEGPEGSRPYERNFTRVGIPLGALVGYQDLHPVDREGQRYGYGSQVSWVGVAGLGGVAQADLTVYLPFWLAQATLTGVSVTSPSVTLQTSGPRPTDGSRWLGDCHYSVSSVYGDLTGLRAPWLAQTDLNCGFSVPIRKDLPWGNYAHSLDLQAGYQGVWLDGHYLDNVYAKIVLGFRTGVVPVALAIPLAAGLRIDQGFRGSQAGTGPRISLYWGGTFY